MKKIHLIIALISVASMAFAQTVTESAPTFTTPSENSFRGRFEKRQQRVAKILKLDNFQLKQLDTINDNYVVQVAVLSEKGDLERKERRDQIITARAQRERSFKNILKPEQLRKWNDLRKGKQKKVFKKK